MGVEWASGESLESEQRTFRAGATSALRGPRILIALECQRQGHLTMNNLLAASRKASVQAEKLRLAVATRCAEFYFAPSLMIWSAR